MNTLIIGGAGYIGAHLVQQLVAKGRQVTVLGRSPAPRFMLPEDVDYIVGDFAQHDMLCELLDLHQEVIHLAYSSVPNTSCENPLADLLQNLEPTVQLFSEVAARGLRLVFVSSGGTVYGEATELPMNETHSVKPISPYGVTKLTLENYANLYATTHGLKCVCVRPSNAYGVGQRPFIGQGFIATAMAFSMRGIPIKIFGEQGTVRDYLYVSDIASGIVSALERGKISQVYNLGSGKGLSNLDVIEDLKPLMQEIGREVQVEHLPDRAYDVRRNILDSSKLTIDTGWKPQVNFIEGMTMTRDWLVNYLND